MDTERFEAIVSAYGAAPRRWPEAERAEAERFARDHAGALEEANHLDGVLDLAADKADVTLPAARIVKRFVSRRTLHSLTSPASPSFWAMAASALIGIALGFSAGATAPVSAANAEPLQALSSAFVSPFDATEDVGG
jgi:hypothetical protein